MSSKKHIPFFLFVIFSLTFAISDTEKKQFQELLKSSKYQNSFTHPLDTLSKTTITNYFNIDENKIIRIVPDSLLPKMSTESLLDSLLLHPIGWDQLENQSENLFLLSITPFFFNVTYELLSREDKDPYNWRLMVKVGEFIPQINFLLSHSFILEKLRKYSWQSFDSIIDYIRSHNKNNVLPISAYPLVVNIIRNENIYKIDLEDENSLSIKDIKKAGGIDSLVFLLDKFLKEKYRFIDRDESYPVKTVKTATGDISYYRKKGGEIWKEYGICLVQHLSVDSLGNEFVIDSRYRNTGLSIDEYIIHKEDYFSRIPEILERKGINKDSVDGTMWSWYDKMINIDKLDELKENGWDPYPHKINEKPENMNNFYSIDVTSGAIAIGEVIKIEKLEKKINTFYDYKYTIKIDQVLKSIQEIENKSTIESLVWYSGSFPNNHIPPLNEKVVLYFLFAGRNKNNTGILRMGTWHDIIDDNVVQNKNMRVHMDIKVPLDLFISKVKKLNEINDAVNFYKKSWRKE